MGAVGSTPAVKVCDDENPHPELAFCACIVNVYDVPTVNPVIVNDVIEEDNSVQLVPPFTEY
jgi:hypothetical protein